LSHFGFLAHELIVLVVELGFGRPQALQIIHRSKFRREQVQDDIAHVDCTPFRRISTALSGKPVFVAFHALVCLVKIEIRCSHVFCRFAGANDHVVGVVYFFWYSNAAYVGDILSFQERYRRFDIQNGIVGLVTFID
jgi:hypothetical protein